jgi:hypothetical protein
MPVITLSAAIDARGWPRISYEIAILRNRCTSGRKTDD